MYMYVCNDDADADDSYHGRDVGTNVVMVVIHI